MAPMEAAAAIASMAKGQFGRYPTTLKLHHKQILIELPTKNDFSKQLNSHTIKSSNGHSIANRFVTYIRKYLGTLSRNLYQLEIDLYKIEPKSYQKILLNALAKSSFKILCSASQKENVDMIFTSAKISYFKLNGPSKTYSVSSLNSKTSERRCDVGHIPLQLSERPRTKRRSNTGFVNTN